MDINPTRKKELVEKRKKQSNLKSRPSYIASYNQLEHPSQTERAGTSKPD